MHFAREAIGALQQINFTAVCVVAEGNDSQWANAFRAADGVEDGSVQGCAPIILSRADEILA